MAADIIRRIHELDRFGSVLGLERLEELLRRLGDPQEGLRCIHVAGTNGKGSVCKYLEQGLISCGYRVGTYISPYIEVFNERIQLDGEYITDEELEACGSRALDAVKSMTDEGLTSPTEFEAVMAIAFLYFAEKEPDIVILETGLGGIGDATNVIRDPMISIITSVAFDHMDVLGDTLEEIAVNKAGIIKAGAPVVSNVDDRGAAAVIARKAYGEGCRFYDVSRVKFAVTDRTPLGQTVSMELLGTDYRDVEISMVGEHQAENLKVALAAIEVLRRERKIRVERSALYAGLKKAVQPGRFEVIAGKEGPGGGKDPIIVLDGAHNEAGAAALQETVKTLFPEERILLVAGMLADKETDKILDHLTGISRDVIAAEPDSPRRLPAEDLADMLKVRNIAPVAVAGSAGECVDIAREKGREYDVILFAGSLYLIGAVRRLLRYED